MGCGIFARGGYVKTSSHIVGCNAEVGELCGHGSVLIGGGRDLEQWEQNQDVQFKLVAEVSPGRGLLCYATG